MSFLKVQSSALENSREVEIPFRIGMAATLKAGELVALTGTLYTGRDQTHRRLCALLDEGLALPVDLAGQLLYYVGPTPARPGQVIGAAGPTTSYRMDAYTPRLLELGLAATLGKGQRSAVVRSAMRKQGAVYLASIGGAGALLSKSIVKAELVAFADAGPEALFRFEVVKFPAVVINDLAGQDYYEMCAASSGR
ncbi:MAG: TRZ/ATZ family protein [Desulfobulbaceae bacterium]|nr:TRZ/ATZ family protein [Desulfobulbaceae bacterium]